MQYTYFPNTAVLSILCVMFQAGLSLCWICWLLTGMASKMYFKPYATVLVASVITSILIHFMFHICCICVHKLLYFSFFSASFCVTFLPTGIGTSIIVHALSFLFLSIISGLFAVMSLCVPFDSVRLLHLHVHILLLCGGGGGMYACQFDVWKIYPVSLRTHSLPKWGILR
jgi:hypothetical protein